MFHFKPTTSTVFERDTLPVLHRIELLLLRGQNALNVSSFGQKHLLNECNIMWQVVTAVHALTCRSSVESVTLCTLSSCSRPNPVCPADMEPLFKDKVGRKWHQNRDQFVINYQLTLISYWTSCVCVADLQRRLLPSGDHGTEGLLSQWI